MVDRDPFSPPDASPSDECHWVPGRQLCPGTPGGPSQNSFEACLERNEAIPGVPRRPSSPSCLRGEPPHADGPLTCTVGFNKAGDMVIGGAPLRTRPLLLAGPEEPGLRAPGPGVARRRRRTAGLRFSLDGRELQVPPQLTPKRRHRVWHVLRDHPLDRLDGLL